jgi:hypothetical protein
MKIEKLVASDRKDKKLKAILDNGKSIHFGLKGSKTFSEGASVETRNNYLKRHVGNPNEKRLIQNNIISPALLSAKLLWGDSPNIKTNLARLNATLK